MDALVPGRPCGKSRLAAVYVRVSSASQHAHGSSLDTQEAACRRLAAEYGYEVDNNLVYREIHRGTELWERPLLSALRRVIRSGEVGVVICHAIDRLSRDAAHLDVLLNEAKVAGVAVEFVSEQQAQSLEGPEHRFVRGYAAEVERERIRERFVRARVARVRSGRLLASARPRFGYRWRDPTKAALDEDARTGSVVRWIFAQAAAGASIRSIAARLTAERVPTPRGEIKVWRTASVRFLLQDSIYTGEGGGLRFRMDMRQSRLSGRAYRHVGLRPEEDRIPLPSGVVPPIVDRATFEKVRERLLLNKQRAGRAAGSGEGALLRGGYARCGYCGRSLAVAWDRLEYRCTANADSPGSCPRRPAIRASVLDVAVRAWIQRVMTDPDSVAAAVTLRRGQDPTADDILAVSRSLAELDRVCQNLTATMALVDADSSRLLNERVGVLNIQRRSLEANRTQLFERRERWQAQQDCLDRLAEATVTVASSAGVLSYSESRNAIEVFGLQTIVWGTDHMPHYEIRTVLACLQSVV